MRTRDIPGGQWQKFLDDFSYLHQGQHVNVETMGEGIGVRSEVHDQPLLGMVAASDASRDFIEVVAGQPVECAQVHSISHPLHLRVAEEDNGQAVGLQIESADGRVTLVRFEPSAESLPPGFRLC